MIKNPFKNANIRSKLLASHLILIAVPTIMVTLFFYYEIYGLVVNDTIRQEQALSKQTSMTMDTTLEQIGKISASVRSNRFLTKILQPVSSESDNFVNSKDEQATFYTTLKSQIDGELVTDIKIYTDLVDDSLYDNPYTNNVFEPLSDTQGSYWSGIFSGSSQYALYCPSFYLSTYEINQYGSLAYIERITTYDNGKLRPLAYIAVYFSKDTLESTLNQDISTTDSVYYILNERENLVAASDYALAGTYMMSYDTIVDTAATSTGFTTKNVVNQDVYAGCYNITGTDWYMVSILPAAPIVAKGNDIINTFIIFYIILLIVAFILAYCISHSLTRRLEDVSYQMRLVRKQKPVRMPDPKIHDEIGDLVDTYNYMTDEMNLLMDHQAQAAEDLRISELRALQAQINPHFLYNTMEMINWLSQTGKRNEVTAAIQALSRFYKLTLSKKDLLTTVAEEAEHAELYVRLQNMRFQDKIQFLVDIPDELLSEHMPKLTFQPVVENSIQHGILEKESKEGTIVLTGWHEGDDAVFLISDDGVGIAPERIQTILSGTGESKKGSNIGVYNTHRRLQILYGPDYGLSYSSTPGQGTEVMIRIGIHGDTAPQELPSQG